MNFWHFLKIGGASVGFFCTLVEIDRKLDEFKIVWQIWAVFAVILVWLVAWGISRKSCRGSNKSSSLVNPLLSEEPTVYPLAMVIGAWPIVLVLIAVFFVSQGLETVCRDIVALLPSTTPNPHATSNLVSLLLLFFLAAPLMFLHYPPAGKVSEKLN